eukprot:517523-Hanusia_phi.AAC.1
MSPIQKGVGAHYPPSSETLSTNNLVRRGRAAARAPREFAGRSLSLVVSPGTLSRAAGAWQSGESPGRTCRRPGRRRALGAGSLWPSGLKLRPDTPV